MPALDVRFPMGLLFLFLGLILVGYGLTADSAMYAAHSLGQNVNVIWGVIFALFGIAMLILAAKAKKGTKQD